jgi:hypothetical protein
MDHSSLGKRVRKPTEMGAQYRAQMEAAKARVAALKEKKERTVKEQKELDDLIGMFGDMKMGGRRRRHHTRKHKKMTRKTRGHKYY